MLLALIFLVVPLASGAEEEPILTSGPVASVGSLAVGKPFPLFTANDVDGKQISPSTLKGKPLLIDFGSIFCIDCQVMAKEMNVLQKTYAPKDLVIIAVVGGSRREEAVRNFFRNLKANYRVVFDMDSAIFDRYGIAQIPFQVVVDRDGIVRTLHAGRPVDGARTLGLEALLNSSNRK